MGKWIGNQRNESNESNNLPNDHFETFIIDKKIENLKYIIHNFQTDYQQIPKIFEYFPPYEFFSKTNKINNVHSHWFHENHHQCKIHNIYEYNIPEIPILQTYTISSQKNDLKNYARTVSIIFSSWSTLFDIKNNLSMSREKNLNKLYFSFSNSTKMVIKDVNILHECKESRDVNWLLIDSMKK
jgi:hypothetical protein